ncbi:MAG: hypothetical protein AAFZ58_06595 [Pseudomonadota bacterium]
MKRFPVLLGAMVVLAGLMALTLAAPVAFAAEPKVTETEFRGAPPFKRERVSAANTDSAAESTSASLKEGDTVRVVDFRGRPPFERRVVEVDEAMLAEAVSIASFARFEEVEDESPTRRRSGPPGKQHIRR